ncbi:hypothetical protein RhiJN_03690 [Ceratobasidium sp. AG-Ba]|nr:hypothetical protein RhiJN_03690 [Ceratobasidium sp. AG-Ba]
MPLISVTVQKNTGLASRIMVITGGNGFIGSHVAKHFHSQGYHIRVVDQQARSQHEDEQFYSELLIGNLCDYSFCQYAVRGAQTILHFAAVMGGMGVIHSQNDEIIYRSNHTMTLNILEASCEAGASNFFYASSACVYPIDLQQKRGDMDIALREDDAYAGFRPNPQHLYGLEKLNSEHLVAQYSGRIKTLIGRFHNVYGPHGSWNDGREKAPGALIRKAIACKFLVELGEKPVFEIWGDGSQRRSFLYIDDAVSAVVRLLEKDGQMPPLNIGSDQSISIDELAKLSLKTAGLTLSDVNVAYINGPLGVASRNSDNALASQLLSWAPSISHQDGLSRTREWMESQMLNILSNRPPESRKQYLRSLLHSSVVDFSSEIIKFAILLPITSRPDPEGLCKNLISFARSLNVTTWRDRTDLCSARYEPYIYLAIDDDDDYLLPSENHPEGRAQSIMRQNGFNNVTAIYCNRPKGHVCALWRDAARRAFKDKCHYYVLMGDDVELLDEGWMRIIHAKFGEISRRSGGPQGFGCVSFTDITFPGMPTFPVVHLTHLEIFDGQVVPEEFINQDGDPYLFQLYCHFGASDVVSCRLHNVIGGDNDARYEKRHISNWTFEILERGKDTVRAWCITQASCVKPKISLDVIVPSYRVNLNCLSKILSLRPSSTCITMFIIIVDDPTSPYVYQLQHMNSYRMDVRIRVNKKNQGASASRNRGLTESSAEWVAFLDDDVDPSPDYLVAAERHIRQRPDAAGFVGNTYFPVARNIFTTAVHLAGVTYFWDIADKISEDVPWGVTANLIARRNIQDGVKFDLIFPKTGGGEDIDFCRQKRQVSLERGGTGFWAAPDVMAVHPWWNGGRRSYWRYYMWSKGDGALIKLYPEYSWGDSTPTSAELLALAALIVAGGLVSFTGPITRFGLILAVSTLVVNLLHDAYRHLWRHKERTQVIKTSIGPIAWVCAVFEGGLIRMVSEMGRLVGVVERREWKSLGKRFDWFTGGPWGITEERSNGIERMILIALACAMLIQVAN